MLQSPGKRPCLLVIGYPKEIKSAQAKKAHRHKIIRENPEALTADISHTGGSSNLLLYTDNTEAWHRAICTHYDHHRKRGICSGRQIVIEDIDKDSPPLTVNIYHNGTIMFQGNEASLSSVQDDFNTIKALAETEKQRQEKTSSEEKSTTNPTAQPPGEQLEEDQLLGDHSGHSSQLETRVSQMRDNLSLQEVELVELKELLLSNQTSAESTQQLRDQLSQVRNELKASIQELRGEV
ncbi:uncharacterized protein LOC116699438 [Etheostoma spectabile]|uniref:uncharacterized protein LOC116699438 n=1 Tax=Etheostoma spectabile TaxID=54343 RepID=UPI0013AEC9C3|nr:uncharacterized protein LOC116699438 [Etheostoma spectabile]